jgi:hypothetical protein
LANCRGGLSEPSCYGVEISAEIFFIGTKNSPHTAMAARKDTPQATELLSPKFIGDACEPRRPRGVNLRGLSSDTSQFLSMTRAID